VSWRTHTRRAGLAVSAVRKALRARSALSWRAQRTPSLHGYMLYKLESGQRIRARCGYGLAQRTRATSWRFRHAASASWPACLQCQQPLVVALAMGSIITPPISCCPEVAR
jgi:hypothetical protein